MINKTYQRAGGGDGKTDLEVIAWYNQRTEYSENKIK